MSDKKPYIIKNMQTGKSEVLIDDFEYVEMYAKSLVKNNPSQEIWVFERKFVVKADIPVIIKNDD